MEITVALLGLALYEVTSRCYVNWPRISALVHAVQPLPESLVNRDFMRWRGGSELGCQDGLVWYP
jgi:hypothetical protein